MPRRRTFKQAKQHALDTLVKAEKMSNTEGAHIDADYALCTLLRDLGYDDVVDAYQRVDKWYA